MSTEATLKLDQLIHENEVYKKWPGIFADKELREARQRRAIEWFDLRKGPHYTEAQLAAYLAQRIQRPCEKTALLDVESEPASSKSEINGSGRNKKPGLSIVTGMTPEQAALLAGALKQKT